MEDYPNNAACGLYGHNYQYTGNGHMYCSDCGSSYDMDEDDLLEWLLKYPEYNVQKAN